MHSGFEAVIGIEVHVQLATESKIFCACPAKPRAGISVADVPTNASTCPICAGHPGTLPVLNRQAVDFAIRAGLATNCRINERNVFARKNYFYPDLPKGYQISQYDKPICEDGWLEIELPAGPKRVRIQRIHMEEDAGKNVHMSGYSLINLNRAGVPLCEIVTAPDLNGPEEAGAYLRALHAVVTYLGICDGNMQEGNFRCDANVSVRPAGSPVLGTRAEIKNVNSFRFVEKAIEYEIRRQIEVLQSGGRVIQETRGYDSAGNKTYTLRSKEEAHDYRYFPDPDLIEVRVPPEWVARCQASLPELPHQKKARYASEFGLSAYDAGVLTSSRPMAEFFERSIERSGLDPRQAAKPAANFLTSEIARRLNDEGLEIHQAKVTPDHLADLVRLAQSGGLSSTGAKQVLGIIWRTGEPVAAVVAREGLTQVSDVSALGAAVDQVLAQFASQAAEFKAGKEKVMGFLVGQAMKATGGKANPSVLQDLIRKKLS